MNKTINDEQEWKKILSPAQYNILRERATEPAFSGKYLNNKEKGMYKCAACGMILFSSYTKFDSGSGWPSFTSPENTKNVRLENDNSEGMKRIEVKCARCGSHLGHVFDDGPKKEGGKRYCINSGSLNFDKKTIK